MKILFIPRGWPSKQHPQWGIFERDQAIALSKLGHKVYYLILDLRPQTGFRKFGITREVEDGVVKYIYYAGTCWVEPLKKFSLNLQFKVIEALFFRLVKHVIKKEGEPDIVYGHYLRYCGRALAVKRRFGIPAVGIEHWSEMGYDNIREDLKQQAAKIYPFLDRQLVVSEALKKNILKNIGVETTVVSDIYGKEFCYKEQVKKDDIIRFVLTGDLIPRKRFDLVLEALDDCVSLPKNALFTIIGDGPEREKLDGLIEKYHLGDIVHMVGRKNREYIVNAMQESDAFILSSFSETFGVAPIEALACGVPVIATDCGGPRSYMNDFNGLLIPINNVKAMSEAIAYMAKHYMEYDRKRIAEDCKGRFSSEAIGKQLESIFEDVIKQSGKK